MWISLSTFVTWALVALSVLYWGLGPLRQGSTVQVAPPASAVVLAGAADTTRVWGAPAAGAATPASVVSGPPPELSQVRLLGVIRPSGGRHDLGLALLAVGDKPGRPFKAGSTVVGEWGLIKVEARAVHLGPLTGPQAGQAQFSLSLPAASASGNGPAAAAPGPQPVPREPAETPPAVEVEVGVPTEGQDAPPNVQLRRPGRGSAL